MSNKAKTLDRSPRGQAADKMTKGAGQTRANPGPLTDVRGDVSTPRHLSNPSC